MSQTIFDSDFNRLSFIFHVPIKFSTSNQIERFSYTNKKKSDLSNFTQRSKQPTPSFKGKRTRRGKPYIFPQEKQTEALPRTDHAPKRSTPTRYHGNVEGSKIKIATMAGRQFGTIQALATPYSRRGRRNADGASCQEEMASAFGISTAPVSLCNIFWKGICV